ncbi:MAG: PAS domain-containing sensor histidine kinase [Chloroflexi bacterium]|nr:PAS domain-containing sensor histidine kinase [Chloroflexota bacterium]
MKTWGTTWGTTRGSPAQHLAALAAVGVTLVVVNWMLGAAPGLQTAVLLYLLPVTLAATRWGFGPSITAAVAAVLAHDLLFIEPVGRLTVARLDEGIGLGLLLFTALVTSQLAVQARRGAETARAAEIARQSDALKSALLRTVSHDLRTPLASIKASVSALRQPETVYSDEDRAELLAAIEEETDHLTRLVTDLLDVSRLEAGALVVHRRPQDLGEHVLDVVRRSRSRLGARSVHLDLPENLPPVAYDYAQIDRVLTNVLENAALYTPSDSAILIGAGRNGGHLWLSIADRGPGVPAGDRARIFQPFERGPTAGHGPNARHGAGSGGGGGRDAVGAARGVDAARGSGLGLAIARGFAEAHGGHLWVEDAPGGGARFVLTLPLAPGELARSSAT